MKKSEGQVLLIVVLVMVVVLTVGLSVVSRGITTLRTSTEEENSQLALSAAEAGVETAMQTQTGSTGPPQSLSNGASIDSVLVTPILGSEFLFNGGSPVTQDDGVNVWLSTYPYYTNPWIGTLNIYWGSSAAGDTCATSGNAMAALEVIVISGSKAFPVTTRYAYDPCTTRRSYNNFSASTPSSVNIQGKTFPYSTQIPIANGLIADIVPLYANTPIGITAASNLPSQGNTITSKGSSGDTQRRIQVFQAYPRVPSELFQYTFFHSQ